MHCPPANLEQECEMQLGALMTHLSGENDAMAVLEAMNDIVLAAEEAKGKRIPGVSFDDVVWTMKAISTHRILVGA